MTLKTTLTIILLSVVFSLKGQGKYSKEGINLDSVDFQNWYDTQNGQPSLFQVIGAYRPLSIPFPGSNPFFGSSYSLKSDLNYRGRTFENVDLVYDQHQDMVFMVHPILNAPMKLQDEHIKWFKMNSHLFKQIDGESGYFQILYEGTELMLVKKNALRIIVSQKNLKYVTENRYYVIREGELNKVKKKKSFLKLFPGKKGAINNYMKQTSRSKFKDNLDFSLTQLTQICDSKSNR